MFPKSGLLSSVLEAQKLKDTFDRRPASWWICSLRFTGGCRDPTCQHKVNGCDSLTAHQSSQMFVIFFSFFLDPIGRRSQIITASSLGKCSAWQPGRRGQMWQPDGRRHCEAAVWLVTLLRNSRRVEGDEGKEKRNRKALCVCVCGGTGEWNQHVRRRTLSLQPLHFLRVTPSRAPLV